MGLCKSRHELQSDKNNLLSTYSGNGKSGWSCLLNVRLNISAKSRVSSIC